MIEASKYYEERALGLGLSFLDSIEEAISDLRMKIYANWIEIFIEQTLYQDQLILVPAGPGWASVSKSRSLSIHR